MRRARVIAGCLFLAAALAACGDEDEALVPAPSKADPAAYTQYVVDTAIALYENQGLDATIVHYSQPDSIDGQWYVFIIDADDRVIAHPDPGHVGLDLKGWVGTDANRYEFGPAMLAATEEGMWVSYVYRNPARGGAGTFELKNVWVQRRDGLRFASGWYIDADVFTEQLVAVAVATYRARGLTGTLDYFAQPGSALAGLEPAVTYYNAAATVDGQWFAFIGAPDGTIAGHSDPAMISQPIAEIFGLVPFPPPNLTADGAWVDVGWLRVFVAGTDGYLFGAGWERDDRFLY